MPGSPPNPEIGRRLRAAREKLGLSTRDVEKLSRSFAERKQNQEYYISHAWLSQIERGEFIPGIFKLYTLSMIYQYRFDRFLSIFGIDINEIAREQMGVPLPRTHLVQPEQGQQITELPPSHLAGVPLDRTDLVSRMFAGFRGLEATLFPAAQSSASIYGYVGTKDLTLSPLIRPGSFVQIDSLQRKVESGGWISVFERPVYFTELRDEYVCSWCEEREGKLLLVPYPHPQNRIREVRYPAEAGIIGRVTAVSMRIADLREKSPA